MRLLTRETRLVATIVAAVLVGVAVVACLGLCKSLGVVSVRHVFQSPCQALDGDALICPYLEPWRGNVRREPGFLFKERRIYCRKYLLRLKVRDHGREVPMKARLIGSRLSTPDGAWSQTLVTAAYSRGWKPLEELRSTNEYDGVTLLAHAPHDQSVRWSNNIVLPEGIDALILDIELELRVGPRTESFTRSFTLTREVQRSYRLVFL